MSRLATRVAIVCAVILALLAPAAPAAGSESRWAWPVRGAHQILRPFIAPATRYAAGHRGIDIATSGTVYAPADAVVQFSGFVVDRPVLSLAHSGRILSSYEPVTSSLVAGDTVRRGQVVATVAPGHCSELCLHFGVRVDGEYVSPLLFLGGILHSVLLPTRPLSITSERPPLALRRGRVPTTGPAQVAPGTRHRDSPRSVRRGSSIAHSPVDRRCRGPGCWLVRRE